MMMLAKVEVELTLDKVMSLMTQQAETTAWQHTDSNQKLRQHMRRLMTPILLPTRRLVADNSNGIGGDKIEALLMVATEGKEFGVVDDGGSDDDGGS